MNELHQTEDLPLVVEGLDREILRVVLQVPAIDAVRLVCGDLARGGQ